MRFNRYTLMWPVVAALAVMAGSAAVAAASPRPDVLTPRQATAALEQARASTATPSPERPLGPDEWAGVLPSAEVAARCVEDQMHLTRWTGWGVRFHDVHAGPAATVSLALTFTGNRVRFAGRCVNGLPTGSYLLNDEPAQDAMFGKWVDSEVKVCKERPRQRTEGGPSTCYETVPLKVLSPAAPRHP